MTSPIGADSITETYGYGDHGERVKKVHSAITTIYEEGLWEEVIGDVSAGENIPWSQMHINSASYY